MLGYRHITERKRTEEVTRLREISAYQRFASINDLPIAAANRKLL